MSTKIRIDLSQGIIEAEGSEEFVKMIYHDYKQVLERPKNAKAPIIAAEKPAEEKQATPPNAKKSDKSTPNKKSSSKTPKTAPKMVNDLDLSGRNCSTSLKDFYSQYKVTSNFEKNLIFIYYLKYIMEIETVSIDHVFTCYRNMNGIKIPGNLEQSIRDTRTKKSWIDYKTIADLSLTVHGINYVEHDIKKDD